MEWLKQNRRIVYAFLLLCAMGTLLVLSVPGLAQNDSPITVDLYRGDLGEGEQLDLSTTEQEVYGIRLHANAALERVEVYVQNVRVAGSRMVFSFYRWESNYAKTVKNDPVYRQQIEGYTRKNWAGTDIPSGTIGEGEWLIVLSDFGGATMLQKCKTKIDDVQLYFAQQEMNGAIMSRVRYASTPDTLFGPLSQSQEEERFLAAPDTWAATDGLGRTLPTNADTGGVRENKFVGMFFWTWHSSFSNTTSANVTEILAEHPDIVHDYTSRYWGGKYSYFWNEPIYGYYDGKDPWVFRRQAELLADAGVDVIIFDQTNGTDTFQEGLTVLLETFAQARADGIRTPQVSFLLPFWDKDSTVVQLRKLYETIFSVGKYQDLWFYWKGKPLVMGYPDKLSPSNEVEAEILDFFTYRPGQPYYKLHEPAAQGQWGWLSLYPQDVYYNEDGTPEQITVGVAQNCNSKDGATTAMNGEGVFGRTYSALLNGYDARENAKLYGANFAEQFEYALEVDPEFIFITGWNEWRAGRYETWGGVENAFPDTFDDTYSRDLEPSKGDLKDHYYYQMVAFIRRYKGTSVNTTGTGGGTIDIHSETDQWESVSPYFASYPGDTFHRDAGGYDQYHYEDQTGRNDIIGAKVTYDEEFVYFLVETAEDLTPSSDPAWMRLFLDVEGQDIPNWETFDYVINRVNPGEKAVVERSTGGWNWEQIGEAEYRVSGCRLQLKVSRELLGITSEDFVLNFKWSDNMQTEGDIMDFYVSGDVAPGGRFKYQFFAGEVLGSGTDEPVSLLVWPWVAGGIAALVAVAACILLFLRKKRAKSSLPA